jgi:hypothetical protein
MIGREQKQKLVNKLKKSNLSVDDFCKKNKIASSTIYGYAKQLGIKIGRAETNSRSDKEWLSIIDSVENRPLNISTVKQLKKHNVAESAYYYNRKRLYPDGYKTTKKVEQVNEPSVDKSPVATSTEGAIFYGKGFEVILRGTVPDCVISMMIALQDGKIEVHDESN